MFFTVWGNGPAKLESANLDGANRQLLINTNIVYPQGITLDHPNRFMFIFSLMFLTFSVLVTSTGLILILILWKDVIMMEHIEKQS